MINGLTVDLEDWRQLIHWRLTGEQITPKQAVVEETEALLALLADHKVKATFFVLANVALAFAELIQRIDTEGHEIASHGLSHVRVYLQSRDEFQHETRRAKELLEELIGKPVLGYRAAEFSITSRSWWALDVLAEEGFVYDSSIYPIAGKRYGVESFPLEPQTISTTRDRMIHEFPLAAVEAAGRRWPVAGGGYLRLLPYRLTHGAISEMNKNGRPAVVYVHPYEFANTTLGLDLPSSELTAKTRARLLRYSAFHNFRRDHVRRSFRKLLEAFSFAPLKELIPDAPVEERILERPRG